MAGCGGLWWEVPFLAVVVVFVFGGVVSCLVVVGGGALSGCRGGGCGVVSWLVVVGRRRRFMAGCGGRRCPFWLSWWCLCSEASFHAWLWWEEVP
eukprot:796622_1